MNRLFGYINILDNVEQLTFKTKILAVAKARGKELNM